MIRKFDTSTGWTTQEVAAFLRVKPRTVHHHVQTGNLHPVKMVRPGVEGGAANVFNPAEVQEFQQRRQEAKTEVVAESVALVAAPEPVHQDGGGIAKLLELLGAAGQAVRLAEKPYLTGEEAVALTGLGLSYIRRFCKAEPKGPKGKLVFKRAELAAL